MSLSTLSINRPVLTVVMSLVILLFGGVGYTFLGVREFPAIDPPVISVRTSYTGANTEIVESQITEPLEKSINGVQGIRTISSNSSLGTSNITVEFELGSNLEQAANDVRDKVSQALRNLPQDIDAPPVVSKADANGDPVIFMPIQSKNMNPMQLSSYVENVLQERLQTIPGVSQVQVFGMKRYAMRLWLNPARLSAFNLTIQNVSEALVRENVDLPSGKIYGNKTELVIKTLGRLTTEEDFNNLIIKQENNQIVRFRDIGKAELGVENEENAVRRNGSVGVSLAIIPQPGSNLVAIADEFYRRFEIIKKELPEDIIMDVGIDKSKYVRHSITEVKETIGIAFLLVVIVIYLFFRDWRVALRPLIDIPVSLIGTFFVMYLLDFSINILTLLAIVLATGLVVDDGIVVTENIYKRIEKGTSPIKAAMEGANEIAFAVFSTSITLAVVFLPVIFMQGFIGALFREFGIVVASSVLISAFVSLTLTPMLSSKLNPNHSLSWFYKTTEPFFVALDKRYKNSLESFLKVKYWALVIVFACFGTIYVLSKTLKNELAPLEDRSIIRMPMTTPEGTSFDETERTVNEVADFVMDSLKETKMVFAIVAGGPAAVSVNGGFVSLVLKEPKERQRTQAQIAEYLGKKTKQFNGARIIPIQEQTISVGFGSGLALPIQFVIQNLDFEKIKTKLPKFIEEVQQSKVFQNSDVNLKFNKPELYITINRLKSNELGVSVHEVANTLQFALSNRRMGYFLMNGKQYQVIAQVERGERDSPIDLKSFYCKSQTTGKLIPLDNLITMKESANPPQIYHYNRYKSATVSASLAPNKTIGEGIEEMNRIKAKILDDSFSTSLSGPSRDFSESSSNTSFALILALVLIFLVLAAQFESFTDPIIILITVPLALAGALASLWFSFQTVNVFSQIGMIMLIGLVTKNGILIVEFSNQLQEQGKKRFEAVLEASVARLRPILMTSLVTVAGAVPLAFSIGSASKSRIPLGIVIVGGLTFSLLLTLYVIPSMYLFLSRRKKKEIVIS